MSIIDVLKNAGDDLKSQLLSESFISLNKKKDYTEITFATEDTKAQSTARGAVYGEVEQYVGVVLWVPKEAFDKTRAARKSQEGGAP